MKKVVTGEKSKGGFYRCLNCGQQFYAQRTDYIPFCPVCTGREFIKNPKE